MGFLFGAVVGLAAGYILRDRITAAIAKYLRH